MLLHTGLIYTIEAGNEEGRFSVDFSSGVISVTEELDFEAKPHYQLTVRATDAAGGGGHADAMVLLGVEDVNDCRPRFEFEEDDESFQGGYSATVSESAPLGTRVLTVSASDADSGENGRLQFSFLRAGGNSSSSSSSSSGQEFFAIDPETGVVTVRKKLDRERIPRHVLAVLATDRGSPSPLSSEATLIVEVEDANDNSPAFEEAVYSMRLSDAAERGQFVGKVRAVDPDDEDAYNLRYAIIGGDDRQVFSMDEETGSISLVNLHNFGQTSLYRLNVSVTDGVFSGSCKVDVSLVSANSFSPVFPDRVIKVGVRENQREGTLVARLNAFDEDRNDRIKYSIPSDEMAALFRVDAATGEVWALKSFDREERAGYEVPLAATDSGGRSGFATLRVRVEDENDCEPEFLLPEYSVMVFSNQTSGSEVARVTAEDRDFGANARLRYSLYENATSAISRAFSVDADTGAVVLRESPAGLENQVFQFFVLAEDLAGKEDDDEVARNHAHVPVEVYVMSPLDRPPVFSEGDTSFLLPENGPVGKVFATVSAYIPANDMSKREAEDGNMESVIRYSRFV